MGLRVAVILSGLDSDGSEALKSIKAARGITFAQKIETAEFPDMPKHALQTGHIDYELTPEDIARELVRVTTT